MKVIRYLKITVSGKTKQECENQFNLMASAVDTEFTDIEKIINDMLSHARIKREKYFGASRYIHHFYDAQQKTLEDLKMRINVPD